MTSRIFGAALLIVLAGFGGYVLASNPHIVNYFHWQKPTMRPVPTDESLPRLDAETKYRLQERCADRAKTFYEEEYAPLEEEMNRNKRSGDPFIHTVYESHYNARLGKCFVYAETKFLPHDVNQKISYTMKVQDVNTRQMYAHYSASECEVRGATCNSELEWWVLVKPYIEELASP